MNHHTHLLAPSAILLFAFFSSAHCGAMCGPLSLAFGETKKNLFLYHFARLLGYLTLTLLFATLGGHLVHQTQHGELTWISWVGAALMGALLVGIGIKTLFFSENATSNGSSFLTFSRFSAKALKKVSSPTLKSGIAGYLSAFLPCGLSYPVLLSTLLLSNWREAIVFISFFWFGTLPVFWGMQALVSKFHFFQKLNSTPKLKGAFFILIGVLIIAIKLLHFSGHGAHS